MGRDQGDAREMASCNMRGIHWRPRCEEGEHFGAGEGIFHADNTRDCMLISLRFQSRFNIELQTSRIFFLYLSHRRWVLASTWPHVTLLGQSLGSLILGFDAFTLLVPDIFIDTMGYAYVLALAKYFFPSMPTGAYVHYPTISTDMLGSLDADGKSKGLNAGTGKGLRGYLKRKYWRLFALSYSWVGGHVDVVMTNSSWTQSHIKSLWGTPRADREKKSEIEVVFPPVAVDELVDAITVSAETERNRENVLLYIAQFRPEKNHTMILKAFADMIHNNTENLQEVVSAKLVLIGSVRDSDDAKRVYELRLLAHELKIKEQVEFVCDASWPDILKWLGKSSVGVNGMWNEHFGIGVVEYQAAGLISVVNDSGGPKQDIVIEHDGGPTGFHASDLREYAEAFAKALMLPTEEKVAMRQRARASARRFGEQEFVNDWLVQSSKLLDLSTASFESDFPEIGICAVAGAYLSFISWEVWKMLFR